MRAIMGDINIEGHVRYLVALMYGERWREIWESLNLSLQTFSSVGLARGAPDVEIWHLCQREQIILITANRNHDGPDSLEATIRQYNTATSLPVMTTADPDRIFSSSPYADRVIEQLLEYLLDIDRVRGTGRLFLP